MKKLAAWISSTGGWVAIPIILGCLGIIYGSIIFDWNNIYSKAVHSATGWWHLAGWILTGAAVIQAIRMNERGSIILFGVLIALSWCAFTGFSL
jgi:hypothetical protein